MPDVVPLSNRPDLSGWLAQYYGETIDWGNAGLFRMRGNQPNNASWSKKGEEIFAHFIVGRFCETPLRLASDTDALQLRALILNPIPKCHMPFAQVHG